MISLLHPSKRALLQLHLAAGLRHKVPPLFFLFTSLLGHLATTANVVSPFLYWVSTLFTTPALLSSSRSWCSHMSVADLLLLAGSDPLLHHPLLPVQANTFLPSLELQAPCTSWHHCLEILLRGSELYTLGFLPLTVINNLSLSSPEQLPAFAFCFTLDLSCNLISTRTVFLNFFYFFLHI